MPITSATLRKLAALNLDAVQMAGVLDVLAEGLEAEEQRRADQAERKRRSRAKNGYVTGQSRDRHSDTPDKETPPTPPKEIKPQDPPIVPPRIRHGDPAIVLQSVVDPMTARAFADHMAQRKPRLSVQSAQGVVDLCREVERLGGSAKEALDLTMAKGWGIPEIDWLKRAGLRLGAEQAKPQAVLDVSTWTPDKWKQALEFCRLRREWQPAYGPPPFSEGCKVPADLLIERDREFSEKSAERLTA